MRRLLACLLIIGCGDATGPRIDGVRFSVSSTYARWWLELEQCSGLRRNMESVSFYVVESIPGQAVGRYQLSGGKQTIELVSLFVNDEPIVKHEMVHALLYDVPGHPAEYFDGRCGDLRNGNIY